MMALGGVLIGSMNPKLAPSPAPRAGAMGLTPAPWASPIASGTIVAAEAVLLASSLMKMASAVEIAVTVHRLPLPARTAAARPTVAARPDSNMARPRAIPPPKSRTVPQSIVTACSLGRAGGRPDRRVPVVSPPRARGGGKRGRAPGNRDHDGDAEAHPLQEADPPAGDLEDVAEDDEVRRRPDDGADAADAGAPRQHEQQPNSVWRAAGLHTQRGEETHTDRQEHGGHGRVADEHADHGRGGAHRQHQAGGGPGGPGITQQQEGEPAVQARDLHRL